MGTGETVAFEALARWEHPSGAVEDPRRFVPIAEDSDLVIELDLAVMTQALRELSHWHPTTPSLRMGVNLSARHFDHPNCVEKILTAAAVSGVSPESVDLAARERPTRDKSEVDVADAGGPMAAPQRPRCHADQALSADDTLAAAVIDALPVATAVLDPAGTIIAVNHAWRTFALNNGATDTDIDDGRSSPRS